MDAPGIQLIQKIDKIGMHCSDTAQISFENVRVPANHVIGEEGQGFMYQMVQFQQERLYGSLVCLRPLERIIEETREYCRMRKVFGKSLLDMQSIHFRLAELETEIEALRALCYAATEKYLNNEDVTRLASMCKLKAGRLARECTDACLQFWGGMGYTNEVLVSRFFRDLRLISIGAGADEVMLSIICKFNNSLPKM